MLQYYDFTAPSSGAEQRISAAGSYIRYYSGSAGGLDSRIVVKCDARGLAVVLKAGQAIRLDEGENAVDWRISNYLRQGGIAGIVVIGDGVLDDSTITGEVSVVDGGLIRTLANQAFFQNQFVGLVAGQSPHIELYNPVASGKNLFAEGVYILSSATCSAIVGGHNAAIPTVGNAVLNKKIGGVAGVGVIRTTNNATLQMALGGGYQIGLVAGIGQQIPFFEPIAIAPGFGVVVCSNAYGVDLTASFEWYEQSI